MYEGILVDVAFAGFFLAKVRSYFFFWLGLFFLLMPNCCVFLQWLGRQSFLDDLSSLDPDLYNGLIFLKHYTGSVEDLSLNFTMAVEGVYRILSYALRFSNLIDPYISFLQNSALRKPWTSFPTGATSPWPRRIDWRISTSSLIIVWASRLSSRAMRSLRGCRRWLIRSGSGRIFLFSIVLSSFIFFFLSLFDLLSFYHSIAFFFRRQHWWLLDLLQDVQSTGSADLDWRC